MKKLLLLSWLLTPAILSATEYSEQEQSFCHGRIAQIIYVATDTANKNTDPEEAAIQFRLIEDWRKRQRSGKNPCELYEDIQRDAHRF